MHHNTLGWTNENTACPVRHIDPQRHGVQVKAMLGGPKGKDAPTLSDDETIEKCLNEVEAALNAGLSFKGKFNSGLQVSTFVTKTCRLVTA